MNDKQRECADNIRATNQIRRRKVVNIKLAQWFREMTCDTNVYVNREINSTAEDPYSYWVARDGNGKEISDFCDDNGTDAGISVDGVFIATEDLHTRFVD